MRINRPEKPVREAFKRHRRVFGEEPDDDIRFYKKLTLDDMSKVKERYGLENTLRYIKTMEARAMGVKK